MSIPASVFAERTKRVPTVPLLAAWICAIVLTLWLLGTNLLPLWGMWQREASLSHGPMLLLIAAGMLWMQRDRLRRWDSASGWGLALLLGATLLHIAAVWADIAFLKPASLFLMVAGGIGYAGGRDALRASAGALGLLAFSLPWPTTLVEAIGFPLQLTSSAYAALFSGMLGLPIVRDGVQIHVLPDPDKAPIYSILVAQQCSGLTSLMVLLSLGYLIACFTPLRWWGRVALVGTVIPLALLANALRLTLILVAGTHFSAQVADWVHDHEQPFLVTLCSLGLIGLRQALLCWPVAVLHSEKAVDTGDEDTASEPDVHPSEKRPTPSLFSSFSPLVLSGVVLLALAGGFWGYRTADLAPAHTDFLRPLALPFRGWATSELQMTDRERDLLRPDAVLLRRYKSQQGDSAELAVIAGHRKQTVHTPAFCMAGGGWETLSHSDATLTLPNGQRISAIRAVMSSNGRESIVTYFFTDGEYSTRGLVRYQATQLVKRFRSESPLGALVRIIVPVRGDRSAAENLSDAFASAVLPEVLKSLQDARQVEPTTVKAVKAPGVRSGLGLKTEDAQSAKMMHLVSGRTEG